MKIHRYILMMILAVTIGGTTAVMSSDVEAGTRNGDQVNKPGIPNPPKPGAPCNP